MIKEAVIDLALQGGGAHGAFTWGVLDRLLEEPDLKIGRVSGTSAGALNGAALVSGFANGGREGAQRRLERLWTLVAQAGYSLSLLLLPLRKTGMGLWDDAPPLTSPYQMNPLGMSPLRAVLDAVLDIDAVRSSAGPKLFVNAVNVKTARNKVFRPAEMSLDVLLASACAPLMFQAIEIGGEAYWDGSYAANPTLWPLYEDRADADLLMVELTPLDYPLAPTTAKNILNRINEIASINGLVTELRSIETINRTASAERVRLHFVSLPEAGEAYLSEPSIKRTVSLELFALLRESGRRACGEWVRTGKDKVG